MNRNRKTITMRRDLNARADSDLRSAAERDSKEEALVSSTERMWLKFSPEGVGRKGEERRRKEGSNGYLWGS
ncbi:hypothetical protein SLA2020_484180 [Shorea laevis]